MDTILKVSPDAPLWMLNRPREAGAPVRHLRQPDEDGRVTLVCQNAQEVLATYTYLRELHWFSSDTREQFCPQEGGMFQLPDFPADVVRVFLNFRYGLTPRKLSYRDAMNVRQVAEFVGDSVTSQKIDFSIYVQHLLEIQPITAQSVRSTHLALQQMGDAIGEEFIYRRVAQAISHWANGEIIEALDAIDPESPTANAALNVVPVCGLFGCIAAPNSINPEYLPVDSRWLEWSAGEGYYPSLVRLAELVFRKLEPLSRFPGRYRELLADAARERGPATMFRPGLCVWNPAAPPCACEIPCSDSVMTIDLGRPDEVERRTAEEERYTSSQQESYVTWVYREGGHPPESLQACIAAAMVGDAKARCRLGFHYDCRGADRRISIANAQPHYAGRSRFWWSGEKGGSGLGPISVNPNVLHTKLNIEWLMPLAESGDTHAMRVLASLLCDKQAMLWGSTRNFDYGPIGFNDDVAREWLYQAAGHGDLRALRALAYGYESGLPGFELDLEQALAWCRRAAEVSDEHEEDVMRERKLSEKLGVDSMFPLAVGEKFGAAVKSAVTDEEGNVTPTCQLFGDILEVCTIS